MLQDPERFRQACHSMTTSDVAQLQSIVEAVEGDVCEDTAEDSQVSVATSSDQLGKADQESSEGIGSIRKKGRLDNMIAKLVSPAQAVVPAAEEETEPEDAEEAEVEFETPSAKRHKPELECDLGMELVGSLSPTSARLMKEALNTEPVPSTKALLKEETGQGAEREKAKAAEAGQEKPKGLFKPKAKAKSKASTKASAKAKSKASTKASTKSKAKASAKPSAKPKAKASVKAKTAPIMVPLPRSTLSQERMAEIALMSHSEIVKRRFQRYRPDLFPPS